MSELIVRYWPLAMTLFFIGIVLLRLYPSYSVLLRRISEDISTENVPPLPFTLLLVNQITELGFHRLGEIRFRWPNSPKELGKEWVFVHESSTVIAEVGAVTNTIPGVFLATRFPDGSQIETGFPAGWNIKDEDYHSHTVVTSLGEAYRYHIAQVQQWQAKHGAPEQIGDMDSMLRMDRSRQAQFGKRKLKVLFRQYAPLLFMGIGLPVGWYSADLAKSAGASTVVYSLIGIAPFVVPVLWIYFQLRSQQRRSTG